MTLNNNVNAILRLFEKHNPNPKTELDFTNPFTLLIAIILSAQSTDKRVNIVTKKLFERISSPQDVIALGIENLEESIKSIGLHRNKSRHIFSASETLARDFNNAMPTEYQDLLSLAGVGRKTANVWSNITQNKPYIAVDTHVTRVSNRIGLVSSTKPTEIEKQLYRIIDQQYHSKISNWLVLHGRYICKAQKPMCDSCFIEKLCMKNKI